MSFRIQKFSENLKSTSLDQVRNETLFFEWIREKKVVNKFTKLSKIGFCMECFTAGFLCVFHKDVNIWLLGILLGTHHQIQVFQQLS